jgi:tripartite-type tricarboxylate transporter receptor subunit TctC
MLRTIVAASLAALGFVVLPASAPAQTYPEKPMRLVVPYAPGGGGGFVARVAADILTEKFGQTVIVDNKPGAGSALGIDLVAKSKPDGYTFIFMTSDGISVLPAVKATVPYKVPEDFSFVAGLVTYSYAISAYSPLPYKTMGEMIAWAKANPGKVRYASSGVGSGTHLTGELISRAAGIDMVHVPFNGAGPAITAAVGGHVDLVIVTPSGVKPHIDAGRLTALATTDTQRHPNLPNTQTLVEAGLPQLNVTGYYGILAPVGTPEPILARWRKEIKDLGDDPRYIKRMEELGFTRAYLPGDAFRKFLVDDLNRWKGVAKAANITVTD